MSLAHKPATISFHSRETARCVRGWHHATDSHMELLSRIPIWKLARYKKSSPHRRERKTLATKTPSSSKMITVHNEMNVAHWSSQVLPRKIVDRQVLKSCSFFRTALKDFFSHFHWRRRIIRFEGSDNNIINIYVFTGEAAEARKLKEVNE